MSTRIKRKHKMSFWDKVDVDVLEATSEAFRIEVDLAFQTFLNGSATDYSFSVNLNNFERKHIHQKAASFNLVSRSHGKDPNRVLTIYKKGTKSNFESFYIDLAPDSMSELNNIIENYSPDSTHKPTSKMSSIEKVFGKLLLGLPPAVMPPVVSPAFRKFQEKLPIYEMKSYVMRKIRENDVLIVSSETGSGKTTQIPQYILEDALEHGETCRIICTQPRRISAVSVAERVAHERGTNLGEGVGYHIRLESKLSSGCNLIYCTNGVLIRSLMSGDSVLQNLTHIIIDEVHERDKLSDFLLICLRESLKKGAKIKLILMSATINVEKFQGYFDGSEMLNIPGRLFPIKELFLDEVLEMTGYDQIVMDRKNVFSENGMNVPTGCGSVQNPQFDDSILQVVHCEGAESDQAWAQFMHFIFTENMSVNYQHSETGITGLMAAVVQDNLDMVEKLCSLGADPTLKSRNGCTAINLADERQQEDSILLFAMAASNSTRPSVSRDDVLINYYKTCADEDINFDLLIRLISTIHSQYKEGAILVFLPGYDDIMLANDRIMDTDLDKNTFRVFFLHGSMNIKEQHEVFKHLNVRKIILSTNIAETSLTIDDVVYVIDCGKAKVQTYDSISGLSSLQVQWISKACVKQRAGRAGRTRTGMCFHLFSRARFDSFLEERVPEILRVPLEELCLNTKTLSGNSMSIYNFLVMAPDPPSSSTVKTAIDNLECLGALDKEENLTPLGEYLSQLTIEPHLGKMLIYSVIFKCLDPILTIVASLAQKDPFQLPPQANLRSAAAEKRKSLMACTMSDHMIYLKAFIKWQEAVRFHKERLFCREYFISPSTMETILKTRSQLLGQLRAAKFVSPNGSFMATLNSYAENWPLVKAVIASGLYPKLAFKKNNNYCTRTEKKVLIHNSSPLSKECAPLWLVYDEMVKARSGHHVRGVTPVTPLTISLMCGIKSSSPQQNYLEVDEWLEFEFPSPHIIYLRKFIETIIEKKLFSPTNSLNDNEEKAILALSKILITEDGLVNLPMPQGIRQKPKFFEINRSHNTSSTAADNGSSTSNGSSSYHSGGSGRFNSTIIQNLPRPPYNNHHARNNGRHVAYHQNQYGKANVSRYFQSFGSAPGGWANSPQGSQFGSGPKHSNNFNNGQVLLSSIEKGPGAPSGAVYPDLENGACALSIAPEYPVLDKSVFLLIKVKLESSVLIAQKSRKWVFAPQTEKQIVSLDNGGMTVYLFYTVYKMNMFYGVAKFVTIEKFKHNKPSAYIEWIFKNTVPYKRVSHLRNPLNNNRLIHDGVDGQIIDPEVAVGLWELFQGNERPLYSTQQF